MATYLEFEEKIRKIEEDIIIAKTKSDEAAVEILNKKLEKEVEKTFKNLIQNYVDCFNDKLNIDDLDLSNIQYMSTVMFKDIVKIITKEEYLEKKVVKENLDLNF